MPKCPQPARRRTVSGCERRQLAGIDFGIIKVVTRPMICTCKLTAKRPASNARHPGRFISLSSHSGLAVGEHGRNARLLKGSRCRFTPTEGLQRWHRTCAISSALLSPTPSWHSDHRHQLHSVSSHRAASGGGVHDIPHCLAPPTLNALHAKGTGVSSRRK